MDVRLAVFLLVTAACLWQVNGQCMRSLAFLEATEEYQEFTTPGYPLYYYNYRTCTWRIYAFNDSHAIRLDVLDCSIEDGPNCDYDYAQVYDGHGIGNLLLGTFCGTSTPTYVSSNSTMMFLFSADASVSSRGIKARYKAGPRESLFDDEVESNNLALILGISITTVVVVIAALAAFKIYKNYKGKKQADTRRQQRPRTSIRVQPLDDDFAPSYYDTHFPPAYEDIAPGPSVAACSTSGFNVNPQPAAYPRRIEPIQAVKHKGDEKAMWRKEPLDQMHGLNGIDIARPPRQPLTIRQEPMPNINVQDTSFGQAETPRYSRPVSVNRPADNVGARSSSALRGRLPSARIRTGILSQNLDMDQKK